MDISSMMIYVLVQTCAPGPSNLMALYAAADAGMARAKQYIFGSMTCYFLKLILCGSLNLVLSHAIPEIIPYMKWVGAAYMLYLAVSLVISGVRGGGDVTRKNNIATFWNGFLMQAVSVKGWILALSVFSIYIIPYTTRPLDLILRSALFFAIMGTETTLWAYCGDKLEKLYRRHRLAFNICMAVPMVYLAIKSLL